MGALIVFNILYNCNLLCSTEINSAARKELPIFCNVLTI